jgi:hypothetical protein
MGLLQIAARVPGQTVETCKAMAYQLAFDKSAGTKSGFFGGYVEVKVGGRCQRSRVDAVSP